MTWVHEPGTGEADLHHMDGVPWSAMPIPSRWHICRPQTKGWFGNERVFRCRCGAVGSLSYGAIRWKEKNSRRKALGKRRRR